MIKYDNEYAQKQYEDKLTIITELNAVNSGYNFKLLDDLSNNGGDQIVLDGKYPISVTKNYTGYYNFYLNYKDLAYIDFYEYENIVDNSGLKAPLNVKVLSANKIKAQVEYLIAIYKLLEAKSKANETKINDFFASLDKKGISYDLEKYNQAQYEYSFEVEKNGISYSCTIDKKTGYIRQDIQIDWQVKKNLDSFILLADNSYKNKA